MILDQSKTVLLSNQFSVRHCLYGAAEEEFLTVRDKIKISNYNLVKA